jgi:2-polyprenyl-3-methyl-5-hydroxy-6-metoxy-1,4-benzoquinol methylase
MPSDAELTNYDSIADIFISHAGRINSWNNIYERPNTLARLPDLNGKNVLDIGCCTGFYSEYALEHGANVTSVDASQVLIDKLKQKIKSSKATFYCTDIGQPMSFLQSDSFDIVIVSLVLDYIKKWDTIFSELYRVTKKHGRVVISTTHPFSDYLYLTKHGRHESYHAFKMIHDTWAISSPHPFDVHYYIRPLNEVLRPMLNSNYKIISIDEPLPDERCKQIEPATYEKLMDGPGFLFIVLEK